jgi:hypothetical protein
MLYKDVKPGQKFIFKDDVNFITPVQVYQKLSVGFVSLNNIGQVHDSPVFDKEEVYLLKCGL